MKKISLVALAFCISAVGFAQDNPQLRTPMEKKVRFGIRAGANLASLNLTDVSGVEVNTKTSMHGGLFVNAPLGGSFAIQPGLEYSGQGAKWKMGTTNSEIDMHYLNVPIMVQWKSTGGFFVETGPQAGFLLGASVNDVDADEGYDKFDLSWGTGLGYLSRMGLGANARYNLGLTNTLDDDGSSSSSKAKNSVIQLGLVYQFGAHK
jgi:hypothetical protein